MNFSRIICNNEMINFNVLDRGELAVDNRIQTIWNRGPDTSLVHKLFHENSTSSY
jgi:hypothetical protein